MTEIEETPDFTDLDFDHIEEAKGLLSHVDATVRVLDVTQSIAVANTHALISIAQSLDAMAFQSELGDDDLGLLTAALDKAVALPAPGWAPPKYPDYFREG